MPKRPTKSVSYVRLSEQRIHEIQDLVDSWPFETKAFMRARLNQYTPASGWINTVLDWMLWFVMAPPDKRFRVLKDPDILTDWQKRFELSGQSNPQQAWNRILEKEVTARDYTYLLSLLNTRLSDVHVPVELEEFFEKIYRAHVRKEYVSDPAIPRAPLILVVGPSGSGKTSTVIETIEKVIFQDRVLPEIDLRQKKEALLDNEPFWRSVDEIDPALAMEIERRQRLNFYKYLASMPVINRLFKKQISKNLSSLEQQAIVVDYDMVTPNDYQTSLAGEPGNYFKKALGDPRKISIRHIEEAHSAFSRVENHAGGAERQQRTLIDTSNIVIDEIITGKRDCLIIATSDQAERFDAAIYRRFVEKGKIINIADYWRNSSNLKQVIRLELQRHDIHVSNQLISKDTSTGPAYIQKDALEQAVELVYKVFDDRTLKVIPSYVRKLIHSIVEIKHNFNPGYLKDALLVRRAFELVAQNSYGDLYKKIVDRMDRKVKWEEYIGDIKDTFSEMTNNCLFYCVDEEKGVVLNGPPGGGKTFLVRTWLSENKEVHDIATSASALQNPANPIDGAVENLEKVFDIAKMIAPTIVFFDEADALAPRRSASGGSPTDKLTNKFLSLIDGEIPLRRVFTVLTTNRLDILDPALIRSKRLKTLEVSGQMSKKDINSIISVCLQGIPLNGNLDIQTIIESAQGLCNTPADYTAFVEKARSLRSTEYEVLQRFRQMRHAGREDKSNFIKFNFKTLAGILSAVNAPRLMQSDIKNDPKQFINHYDGICQLCDKIKSADQYPITNAHLQSAKREISQSPVKKGKVALDEFLEAELSQEPQTGFIIGVGANDVSGVLLPIATSLTNRVSDSNVIVTGAVSSTSSAAAQLDMAVQMTQQSAQEALTMVKNYLQDLDPKISSARLLGDFLKNYTLHHQLLSATYNAGGPSAGYALAINTLSALMLIPVYNDFGITGAPWTKGAKQGEVGGSVIIGGHKKKAEKVLIYLRRMYMPLKNYMDLEQNFLTGYWSQSKDILGVTHFGDLIPEVVWLGPGYERRLMKLIDLRIKYKLTKHQGQKPVLGTKETILKIKESLKNEVEEQIRKRLVAIRHYLRKTDPDPHLSLQEIYRYTPGRVSQWINPLLRSAKTKLKDRKKNNS
ncbi:MAG: AAA family ATPase [Desulfobacteraceae bacterium]|nr:AAA family ATPase [Desulfobacteraceae bacterium]